VVVLRRTISHQQPAPGMSRAQVEETNAKRRALDEADALAKGGRYAEAIAAYDAFLTRYPHSTVARDSRAKAQRLLDETTPKPEVTRTNRKPKEPAATKAEEPPKKKPSRWQRLKRWLNEDPSKPKPP